MQMIWLLLCVLQVLTPARQVAQPTVPATSQLDGVYLEAFLVALKDFKSLPDLSPEKKVLTGYVLLFKSESKTVVVSFIPKWPAGSLPTGETSYGRSVSYTLDSKTYRVLDRSFGE